ncbi:protein translocase subunit SecD [Parerythrobacter lacustris]|uniref:Protein translocase subunit SecD n=1 Tax=Parerythrobacter lacustris TaxID=2969984 RepID=A0ABT1XMM2_9SPHN|nr:protein translocase subunit SecD [Parerythrobacter lacustris]MCR2832915.1 protein translocase subunit SecD [Parerythrobacter lacustris]
MLEFPTWKKVWLWGITLAAIVAALPSLFNIANVRWPDSLPDPQVNLGLDLAGGSHILLEADTSQVASQRLQNMEDAVRSALRSAEPRIRVGDVSTRDGRLSFMVESPADVDRAREEILPLVNGSGLVREWNLEVVDQTRFVLTPTSAGSETALNSAMDSARDIIDRRVNSLGTREPTIIRQGENRIVVQVPGLDDPDEVKELVGKTAKLEFKLVDPEFQQDLPNETAGEVTKVGTQVVPYAKGTPQEGFSVVVRRLGGIQGDSLIDAKAGNDPQDNSPVVNITFDAQGGSRFAKLSAENVNRRFAIILDGEVISAPNFNEPIYGGQAQISGNFTTESAIALAIQLQSGALPVDLEIVEERTVGPDLGADSIKKGLIAIMIGLFAVIALMIATYGRFGLYATYALILNVGMLFGIMAIGNTTLTLPGLAGFVITIGAAVDANVLINERIAEERRRGRRVVAAVETGYKEASRAIYDANVTNFIAGVLLFLFGSGPVRGFAVVLIIGLFTSVFTAVTLTRMWVAGWLRKARPNELVI